MENTDWKGFKELWGESSILFKLVSGISIFLAISAITSLSEEVFRWRGFIKDGVDFYRFSLILPVRDFLERFGFLISQDEADFLVFYGGYTALFIRGSWMSSKAYGAEVARKTYRIIPILTTIILSSVYLLIWIYSAIGTSESKQSPVILWIMGILLLLPAIGPYYLERHQKLEYLKPLLFVVLCVFIFAAINKGLTMNP
ncbi:hypothetical protein [Methylophaga nitratireducenticrescens]|uniref:hypothetical protein n=1 Tax=Methylophaga nitratireducenticrescens TaxID=754476 RepID=UPI000CDBE8C2|nr:hypothetical protein [Methylophaga nitratireducenticrescens]AUZ84173.1 hypothetical protein CDW43_06110 [Methylophaga nitratireducenticrescens]